MLMEPIWNGFVMPAQDLSAQVLETISLHALRLAGAMSSFGYRGLVNIDAIVAPNGRVWFNEVNARLGGCTHLHHLATALLGPQWERHHVLVAHNDLSVTSVPRLLEALNESGSAFNPATGTGVVITADDTLNCGTVEYAALAPDLDTARASELDLRALAHRAA
ncbi:peptide ligase PGM1-related protein [Streptomyces sp. NPDC006529]|uniref:peptide ligase PGM1-related protein n=1 Tax=Streptomyces sp. NPDC006529 TaxID=3157177 RepID=UPI0033A5EDAD